MTPFITTLADDQRLYRYLPFEAFVSMIENRQMRLSNVNCWDDQWEAILGKVPTLRDDGTVVKPLYSFHQLVHGCCWTRLRESDAMWRIYSTSRTGVQIETTVKKFRSIERVRLCTVEDVIYFDSIADLLQKAPPFEGNPFGEALVKRSAFSHEHEVRFLTHTDFVDAEAKCSSGIELPINPAEFIEGVTVDPRAEDWFVNAVTRYCSRAALCVSVQRSNLYDPTPESRIGLVRRYVPVTPKPAKPSAEVEPAR